MLHSPLTGSYANTYSSAPSPLDGQNIVHSDASIMSSALPTFLPTGLSFSSLPAQFKTPLGSVSTAFTSNANLSFGTEVTANNKNNNSLSGSSSSLSSLVSLHSNPHSCGSSLVTQKSYQLGSGSNFGAIASVPRCSLWLKLQICPSWHRSQQPVSSAPSSSAEPQTTRDAITSEDNGSLSNTFDSGGRCPFPSDMCPYAHPSSNIQVENGFVTVCYDFIKRKNCKHSCCKYYHPAAHQIEAILKRGDEQKKLLDSQQKLFDSKAFLSMHPTQPPAPNGLPGVCTTGLSWPTTSLIQPNTVYGAYLSPGQQTLSAGLNPLSFVSSGSDPTSLNTSALLAAAAAAFQQQQQGIPSSGLLVTTSPSTKATTMNVGANSSSEANSIGQHLSAASRATLLSNSNATGHSAAGTAAYTNKVMTSSEQQVVAAAMQAAALAANSGLMAVAARAAMPNSNEHSATQLESTNMAAYAVPSMSAITTASCSTAATFVRAGMKREAASSTGNVNAGLDTHSWYPAKRSNHTGGYSHEGTPKGSDLSDNSSGAICNGNGLHSGQDRPTGEPETSGSAAGEFVSEPNATNNFYPVFSSASTGFTLSPAFCGSIAPHLTQASSTAPVSNLLTPMSVNLYGLPFSTAPTAASPYVSPQLTPYSSTAMYPAPTDNPNSIANAAAALALSNWLQQQHQSAPSHTLLPTQVPGTHQLSTPSALAAALAAVQQHHSSPDLHTNAQHSPAFQHHNPNNQQQHQQALLLSTLLRAQQSQLAAVQMAAAVQAAGYLQTSTSPRPINMLETPYSIPGSLTGLQTTPYATAFPCIQNPITNVAYINDKGHLLETLPICRDFKAGKCHRNGDCRYVHLVDESVEVNQGRVIVCRDAAKGRCTRVPCKYYHVPLHAISANRSLALNSVLANAASVPSSNSGASGGSCGL